MANGTIKKVQDIRIGEQVMGDNSKPRQIMSISRNDSVMYKVIQTKGDDYIVDENHILSLKVVKTNGKGINC
jgi:replicative DNA helicase